MSSFVTAFTEKCKFKTDLYNLEFPATILVFGEPKSGKTHFVLNLLKKIKSDFDEIVLYLGSKDTAPSFLELIPNNHKPIIKILFNYNEDDLKKYYDKIEDDQIKLIKAKKNPKRYLIVADDIYSFPQLMKTNRQNPSVIEKLFANYRHLNLSIMITSQRLKQITPSLRGMFKYAFICSLGRKDIDELSKENENVYFSKQDIIDSYEFVRKRDNALGHIFFINKDVPEKDRFQYITPSNQIEIIEPPKNI
jgi:hypothetical protein